MHKLRSRLLASLILAGFGLGLSGCVLPPPPRLAGGWCFYHPYRCR